MVNLTRLCVDIRDSHDDQRSTYGLRIRLQYPKIIGFIPKHNNFIRFWDGQNGSPNKKRHLQLKDSPRSATLNTRSVRRKRLRALPLGHVEPQGWLKEVLTVLMWRFEGKQKNKLMQYHQLCPSRCITKYMDSCHQPIEAVMPTSHGCEAIRPLPYMHAFVLTCFYDI